MWAKSQKSSHTLDLLASKSYIPNYYIIKVIHETRTEIRTHVSFSSPIASQKSPRAASWHYFTEYLDLVLISGFLTSESPPPLFSFVFYRFCWWNTTLETCLFWQALMATGNSTWSPQKTFLITLEWRKSPVVLAGFHPETLPLVL